jgi:hypothetical protein
VKSAGNFSPALFFSLELAVTKIVKQEQMCYHKICFTRKSTSFFQGQIIADKLVSMLIFAEWGALAPVGLRVSQRRE